MASSPLNEDIFSHLRQPLDPKDLEQREKTITDRVFAASEKAEKRQNELITLNSGTPITISSIRVLHAPNTRHSFLAHILDPVLSSNRDPNEPYTLSLALSTLSSTVDQLSRLDIFAPPISTFLDRSEPTDASTSPLDHTVFLSARERGRYTIQTGTEAGSSEGSAYLNVVFRNLFGGAERLSGNASLGTRTRDAYSATFDLPVVAVSPDLRWELSAHKASTLKPFAGHEEVTAGAGTRITWRGGEKSRHEFGYAGVRRTNTGLSEKASPAVRRDAGESFKEGWRYVFTRDGRDVPMLPGSGTLLRAAAEVAGWGPLKGDVGFGKLELESQAAIPVPIPGIKGESGVAFTLGLRGGVLAPLPLLRGDGEIKSSRINDRFQLGGPTDVRGFRLSGLGPRDGQDAVGGDVYAAGGASLLLPFPRLGKDTPLRFQAFVNGGRLLALRDTRADKTAPLNMSDVGNGLARTLGDLTASLPSAAAGFGIVYAHPAARVEVNFSLPLVIRKSEEGRKGLSFGIGLNFM